MTLVAATATTFLPIGMDVAGPLGEWWAAQLPTVAVTPVEPVGGQPTAPKPGRAL